MDTSKIRSHIDGLVFYGCQVFSSQKAEIAFLSPLLSPGVLQNPVFHQFPIMDGFPPAHTGHRMIGELPRLDIIATIRLNSLNTLTQFILRIGDENAFRVIIQVRGCIESHRDGPILEYFLHHGLLVRGTIEPFAHVTVILDLPDFGRLETLVMATVGVLSIRLAKILNDRKTS